MGARSNIVLGLVALVLGVICVIDANLFRSTDEAEETASKIFDFEEGAIAKMEIRREEGSFTLEKGIDGLWYVAEPILYRADQSVLEGLTLNLRTLRKIHTIPLAADTDLSPYGLDSPALEMTFWITDLPEKVSIGADDPEGGVYIRVEGRERGVYTVSRSLKEMADRPLDDFRERRLIPFQTYNVASLAMQAGDWTVQWKRIEDDWEVANREVADWADDQAIDALLRRVQDVRALSFQDDVDETEASKLGIGDSAPLKDRHILEISLKNDTTPRTVEMGKPVDRDGRPLVPARVFSSDEKTTILFLPPEILEIFGQEFDSFRRKVALGFSSYDVDRFSFVSGEDEMKASRKDGQWMIEAPRKIEADPDEVRVLLRALESLEIIDFVDDRTKRDLAPYGLEEWSRKITVGIAEEEIALWLGNPTPDGEGVYALRSDPESVIAVNPGTLPMEAQEVFLRVLRRRVLDFSTYDSQTLEIRMGQTATTFTKEEGKWNREGVREVMLALSSLQAMRYVPGDMEPAVISVTVALGDGTKHTVHFAEAGGEEGVHAQVEGSDLVFLANRTLVEDIRALITP